MKRDLNWVDWDNDRHQEGWLSYMNLGVDSWRSWLESRIADIVQRYDVDAYFLDIVGGWVNNPKADMHEGTRRLVAELRRRFPRVPVVGEMHYSRILSSTPSAASVPWSTDRGSCCPSGRFTLPDALKSKAAR